MLVVLIYLVTFSVALSFAPFGHHGFKFGLPRVQRHFSKYSSEYQGFKLCMKLSTSEKIIVVGVAADSGCGKSTFMRRLTKAFGGQQVALLGGGIENGGWETNTLVSDKTTVLCLDDYHLNDRVGRKVSGLTALNIAEQKFDLMAEHLNALKNGQPIAKPIYNHINGTLDASEKIEPTPIVIVEGLHPLVDERVRNLLDVTVYLDISDDIKYAWKIKRDMAERGWTRAQVEADIELRKPDFATFVAPQMQYSDIVISVQPSEISSQPLGTHLKVKLIQKLGKQGLPPAYILNEDAQAVVIPSGKSIKIDPSSGLKLASYKDMFCGHAVVVLEMDGKFTDINSYVDIEPLLSNSAAKVPNEVSKELQRMGPEAPGSLDGTGLFQTIIALKLRRYYEYITGTSV